MASGRADGSHIPGIAAAPIFYLAYNECSMVDATQMTKWHFLALLYPKETHFSKRHQALKASHTLHDI